MKHVSLLPAFKSAFCFYLILMGKFSDHFLISECSSDFEFFRLATLITMQQLWQLEKFR